MDRKRINRRQFVASTAAATSVIVTAGAGCGFPPPSDVLIEGLDQATASALVRMARLLYPHDALADTTYADVVQGLVLDSETLSSCVEVLDAASSADWLDLSGDEQITVMRGIEDSAFFASVQNAVRVGLYNHPDLWKIIRYPGPSLEFGGYLDRGFDDIDWLPEDE